LLTVSGEPLVALQMKQLAKAGIRRFLIEVDIVSGALVAAADAVVQRGLTVEFIRAPKELQDRLGAGELLFVLSDGIVANDELIAKMIEKPSAYIVTVDGRKENELFERIDLNSFWGGLAMLDRSSVAAIASLPDEWSIGSSLLRQALQDAVVHRPLAQELLTSKQLRRVITPSDAAELSSQLLARRAQNADGWIEAQIFGPLAAKLAPTFWSIQNNGRILDGLLLVVAALSIFFASAGFAAASLAAIIAALFFIQLRDLLDLSAQRSGLHGMIGILIWMCLAIGILAIGWTTGRAALSGLFIPGVMLALQLFASRASLSAKQKALLASPALAAGVLLAAGLAGEWALGLKIVIVGQLVGLIWPLYFSGYFSGYLPHKGQSDLY
jgi:hypothetical protein